MLRVPASSSGLHFSLRRQANALASQSSASIVVGRSSTVLVHANKGFGQGTAKAPKDDPKKKPRAKNFKKTLPQTVTPQEMLPFGDQQFQAVQKIEQRIEDEREDDEFSQRLLALKVQGEEKRRERGVSPGATSPSAAPVAAFDAEPTNIYANPPTITETLVSQLNSEVSDPKMKTAQFGPNQVGVAAGAIIFGLVFVLVAGGDFAPNNRFKGVRAANEAPDAVEEGIIKGRISQLEQQLQATPGDTEATQALALSYAQLLKYDKAASIMEKLTQRDPKNADAWRLLGETSLLAEQSQRAVKAYEQAVALRGNDLQIATGLVDSYIANAQQAKAVEYLKQLRTKAPSVSALGVAAVDAPAATSSSSAPEVLAAPELQASRSEAGSAGSSSSSEAASTSGAGSDAQQPGQRAPGAPIRPLDPVSIELLLAKTYSGWRGHDVDALATYDALIARFPEDFRGYLAKGVYLRDKGRRADAERMFLQARFFAPENRQRFVQQTAETKPIVDLPDND
uniref:Uncharacterized protein n=1 Tax=Chlamydomonas leiostraca TaxID=1034604 RepID=A0A7S0X244_9CHLO|mmetsp:Transcript_6774/g.16874  ORF Transcript_6774/g.16874 Transcript_6774/m.16874 type:complete len:511 (+) Transcript_6774:112-1644(+)|eukprot:CAMPEP_0202858608 /NCGR_PEP_ID=MMETSP1391-20130828/1063_1 /ASSEMBLY_ACC=CAM_ASM_000867 /TAXON_ID=1034604 /ORGANISM="Chlamydomonas leiostraca, Strain SAG 11-49" /LENGTH=510 /DNA_ID=CAMNT_0049537539 /DNA_START=110 /DNA_END=1642 /DNA_ORIENTATION=-